MRTEQSAVDFVALPIPRNFRDPIISIAFRDSIPSRAFVPMPETAVDEHNFTKSRENEVGSSRQRFAMESKAIP